MAEEKERDRNVINLGQIKRQILVTEPSEWALMNDPSSRVTPATQP